MIVFCAFEDAFSKLATLLGNVEALIAQVT